MGSLKSSCTYSLCPLLKVSAKMSARFLFRPGRLKYRLIMAVSVILVFAFTYFSVDARILVRHLILSSSRRYYESGIEFLPVEFRS